MTGVGCGKDVRLLMFVWSSGLAVCITRVCDVLAVSPL